MMSTQKILVFTLLINLIMGWCLQVYQDPTVFVPTSITDEVDRINNEQTTIDNEPGNWIEEAYSFFERTIGNIISWGNVLWNLLFSGLNPFHIDTTDLDDAEKYVVDMIQYFRALLVGIIILEAYLVIKNKKNS